MNMNETESQVNLPAESVGALALSRGADEMFCRFRALGLPIHRAAIEGGRPGISPENARRLAQRPKIRARVAYLTRQEEDVLAEQRRILLERQWLWHDSDIGDFLDPVSYCPLVHEAPSNSSL